MKWLLAAERQPKVWASSALLARKIGLLVEVLTCKNGEVGASYSSCILAIRSSVTFMTSEPTTSMEPIPGYPLTSP